jgi:hypothetical protein
MKNNNKKNPKTNVLEWFMMTEEDVLGKFMSLPNAQMVGQGDERFVYVPGTREKDKVLLVAHSDTVFSDNTRPDVGYTCGTFYSRNKHMGIGADDRAGCAMLWELRNFGHSLLIPCGEESGCVGSRFLMRQKEWPKIIAEHNFAIEMDRMNARDLVFYDVGRAEFTKWCEANFIKYKLAYGSFTDIRVLCEEICGLNISVGYYHQHSAKEILVEKEWMTTLNALKRVLMFKNLPRFERIKQTWNTSNYRSYHYPTTYQDDYRDLIGLDNDEDTSIPLIKETKKTVSVAQDLAVCPYCSGIMDKTEYKINENKCVFDNCKKAF